MRGFNVYDDVCSADEVFSGDASLCRLWPLGCNQITRQSDGSFMMHLEKVTNRSNWLRFVWKFS